MVIRKLSAAAAAALVVVAGVVPGAGCTSLWDEGYAPLEANGGGGAAGTGGAGTGAAASTTGSAGTAGSIGSGGATTGGGAGGSAAVCGNGRIEPSETCDDGNVSSKDGCSSDCQLEGGSCDDTIGVEIGKKDELIFQGTTVGGGTMAVACGKLGPHRIYAVTPKSNGFLTASLTPKTDMFDSTLFILKTCGSDAVLACADGASREVASIEVTADTPVYVVVGGVDEKDDGDFELTLDLSNGHNCDDPIPILIGKGTGVDLRGSTTDKGKGASCTASLPALGENSPDVVYRAKLLEKGTHTVTLDAKYSSILYARAKCATENTQLDCKDVFAVSGETFDIDVKDSGGDIVPNSDAFVWIDGTTYSKLEASGTYQLQVTPP